MRVFSFDFRQPGRADQARKTKFFRLLYGYSKKVTKRFDDGRESTHVYQYPGILGEIPHIRLGKSVFAVPPGSEKPVLELFESFTEVVFYQFDGWLHESISSHIGIKELIFSSNLIAKFGFLSILLVIARKEGALLRNELIDQGFDMDYIDLAISNLQKNRLLIEEADGILCTNRGELVSKTLLDAIDTE